jgi:hypothetical protein
VRSARSIVWALIFTSALSISGCWKSRTPNCYVFPKEYVGWVSVNYGVASAAPLPIRDGCLWLDFTKQPEIRTSSALESGWALDRYFDSDGSELLKLTAEEGPSRAVRGTHHVFIGSGTATESTTGFAFVGTEAQHKAHPEP